MNHVTTYWNRSAEAAYGWTAAEAVGKISCQLLGTTFPIPHDIRPVCHGSLESFCPETGTSVPSRGRRRCSEPEAAVCVLSLQLRIPKLQQGTFFRRSLKRAGLRRRRWAVIQEASIGGSRPAGRRSAIGDQQELNFEAVQRHRRAGQPKHCGTGFCHNRDGRSARQPVPGETKASAFRAGYYRPVRALVPSLAHDVPAFIQLYNKKYSR